MPRPLLESYDIEQAEQQADYEPGKDSPEPELRERIKELTEQRLDLGVKHLTFARLRMKNVARCNDVFHNFDDWSEADWAVALGGEVGELVGAINRLVEHSGNIFNLVKKMRRGDIEYSDIEELSDEIADVQTYLDLLAAKFKIDLADATIKKFNKVSDKRGSNIKL